MRVMTNKAKMVPIEKAKPATPILFKPYVIAMIFFAAGWLSSVMYYRTATPDQSQTSQRQGQEPETLLSKPGLSNPLLPNTSAKQTHSSSLASDARDNNSDAGSDKDSRSGSASTSATNTRVPSGGGLSLDDIWMSNDSAAWRKASQEILQQARKLIQQNRTGRARELVDNILRLDEKNIDALELSALIYKKQGQALLALSDIYRARDAALGTDREASFHQASRQWLADLASNLRQRGDDIGLLDLYKKAVELEPDYGRYYLYLAKQYLALGNTYDAVNTLETARFDSSISVEIDNLLASAQNQKPLDLSTALKIPLTKYGHQFYVKVRINGQYETTWLLDTGASLSAISPQTFAGFPIDAVDEGSAWFNTANGMVEGKTLLINGLDIDTVHIDHLKVGVLDLSSQGRFDGLLGMDFLRQFSFYLDQGEKTLYLRRP